MLRHLERHVELRQNALSGLDVRWIGVHCETEEVVRREAMRRDRLRNTARWQVPRVHDAYLKWILHDWNDARSIAILRACHLHSCPSQKHSPMK